MVRFACRWALATAAARTEIARTLLTPCARRPHPEPPAMNTLQQTLCKILPRSWFAAIGLLVTLVWLYVSILRLLAKPQSRD